MLKLLGNEPSINVRKVLWLCDEIGLPFVLEPRGSGARDTADPAFDNAAAVATSVADWTRLVGNLDRHMAATGAYVTGRVLTLADIVIGLALSRWVLTSLARPVFQHVEAYYDRLSGRAAFLWHARNGLPRDRVQAARAE